MHQPLPSLLKSMTTQPTVGASAIFASLSTHQANQGFFNVLFRGASWLLVVAVLLVLGVSNQIRDFSLGPVIGLLVSYSLYGVLLEITSRRWQQQYQQTWFRASRIAINYIFITGLLWINPALGQYFWFFYSLPIFQAIVYFRGRVVVAVALGSIGTYWLSVVELIFQGSQRTADYALVVVNSLILALLTVVFYWLFRSAWANKVEMMEKTHKSLILLETLNQISRRINAARTSDEILQVALTEGLHALQTGEGSILLLNPQSNQLEFRAWSVNGAFVQDKTHRRLTKEEGIAGRVIRTGEPYNCQDTLQDPGYIASYTGRQPRSLLCVPIVADGPVWGVINADSPEIAFFEQQDVEFLHALAGNLAIALTKTQLYERSQWMVATLLGLHEATTAMQSELELATLLATISQRATQLLNADSGGILLLDETGEFLRFRGWYGLGDKAAHGTCDRVGQSIAGRVVAEKRAIIANDIPNDPRFENPAAVEEGFLAIVSTPLWQRDTVIGTLDIHSKTQIDAFSEDDLTILSLMAQHAAVAIEKAKRFAVEYRHNQAYSLVRRVLEAADRPTQTNRLDALLLALERELQQQLPGTVYAVVLKNQQGYWRYNYFNRNHEEPYRPRWQRPPEKSLPVHLINGNVSLNLPTGVSDYCQEHDLHLDSTQANASWVGLPLVVGDLTIGAMTMQATSADHLPQDDCEFFTLVAQQLAGIIYTAWVDEQRTELYRQLTTLQGASETIMLLAEKNEDWLWHATLTLATAHYGLRFERAVLFLMTRERHRLRGWSGIGHFERDLAIRDWAKDEHGGMTFERYLEQLQAGKLTPTPIEQAVRGWQIDLGHDTNAFARVLEEGKIESVPAHETTQRLPPVFVERFGVCDYALVPVKAGNRVLGLVVLSNPVKKETQNHEALVYFQTLTNQAALIYEALRQRKRLAHFINISHKVLVRVNSQHLGDTLAEICQAAKELTDADLVALHPLLSNHSPAQYDLANARYAVADRLTPVALDHYPSSFTRYIMETGPIWINHVAADNTVYGGIRAADHNFVQKHKIQALIGVPIRGPVTQKTRGILYLNFHAPQDFTEQEIHLAEAFAMLANLAIRQRQEYVNMNSENAAKAEELQILGEVLQKALVYGVNERDFAHMILSYARQLFKEPDIRCSLSLIGRSTSGAQPFNLRKYTHRYALTAAGLLEEEECPLAPNVAKAQAIWSIDCSEDEIEVPVITPTAQAIGVLAIGAVEASVLTDKHKAVLERLTAVIGLALDNLRRQQNLHTIVDAAVAMTAPTTLDATLDAVLLAARRVAPDLSNLTLWYKSPFTGVLTLGKTYGVQHEAALRREHPHKNSLIGAVMTARKPIWAEDVAHNAILANSTFVAREGLKSSVAFSLQAQDEPVGVMFFSYRQEHKFTGEEHALFPILAQIAATCINQALLLEKANKERKRHEANAEIVNAIGGNADLDETLRRVLRSLIKLLPGVAPCILLYDETNQMLNFTPAVGEFYVMDNPAELPTKQLALNTCSIAGTLALLSKERGQKLMVNVPNVHQPSFTLKAEPNTIGTEFPAGLQPHYLQLRQETQSQFTITLYSEQRQRLIGVLALESCELNSFDRDTEMTMWVVAKQIRLMLERHLAAAEMRFKDTVAGATAWAADLAHDINRQTGLIRNRAHWLAQEFCVSVEGSQYLLEIDQAAQQLAGVLVNSTPDDSTELAHIDLHQHLREWVTEIVEKRGADTQVSYDFPTPQLWLTTRPLPLRRVIRNLVRNALEAMGWATEQHLICRTQRLSSQSVEIQIEDNGPGISDSKISQTIFNQPISSKGSGHGYGLLFVRDALERMGGSVRLLPQTPGKGAIFVITLPML